MKKLILTFTALLAFAIIVVSCDKDDDHQVPATSLPTSASTFLNTFFKDVTIRKVEKQTPTATNKTAYSVELANGIEVDFDQEGNWKEVESDNDTAIPTGFISSTIVSYVDTNHKQHKSVPSIKLLLDLKSN
ncbi:PepSY-like domain-containing protein [Sphingobacterium sp. KU25419]|nr:PepSY-like domain-containing protein [Sphingobacterium sp. KU25419]